VRRGQRKGERLTVRTPVITLGRGDFNEVRLPDASVSTSHARIQLREGVWVIADLGSTNGTAVDGEPVAEETPLTPGCTLRLGDFDLLFEPLDAGGGPAPAPAAAAAAGGAPPAPDASSGRPAWYAVGFILLLAALAAWALLS
jgi:pSer/pThr/pTyr-binding forkhead associated (FHA) protein